MAAAALHNAQFAMAPGTAEANWRVHVAASPDSAVAGSAFVLQRGYTCVGRHPPGGGGQLVIADAHIADAHLELEVTDSPRRLQWQVTAGSPPIFQAGQPALRGDARNGTVLRLGDTVLVIERDTGAFAFGDLAAPEVPGASCKARGLRIQIAEAAAANHPVLLQGPSGTGKELAAAMLHRLSARKGELVRVNVTAIPEQLFEATLFGHQRGAFTGAMESRLGHVREAHGGTLVLDEIGELPLSVQPKLLRLLDGAAIRPVGSAKDVEYDVLFCASTNADLDALAAAGRFRRDLLARLRMISIELPRLDTRRPDILTLADVVLPDPRGKWRNVLSAELVEWLLLQRYDDNIRELKAILLKTQMASRHGAVTPALLEQALGWAKPPPDYTPRADPTQLVPESLRPPRRRTPEARRPDPVTLDKLLRHYRGNLGQLSQAMGCDRKQLYRWIAYAGLSADDLARYRDGD